MATNADDTAVDDSKEVTEDDLRDLKYPKEDVEASEEADEATEGDETEEESEEASEADGQTDDQATEETDEDDETSEDEESTDFVKEFPNIKGDTPEEYAKNLEAAYKNSTAEALRLKHLADSKSSDEKESTEDTVVDLSSPVSLYMKQKMDEEITSAFTDFSKQFPQVNDQTEYARFTSEVAILSQTILQSQKRLAAPRELYSKAAVILGWEPENKVDSKDKLNAAIKNQAAVSKTNSATKPKASKSRVTDAMLAANRLMYPGKTDEEIRKELEPYVQ